MYGISKIRSVSVGLDSPIWYLFIYITGYLNVRKISETMDFRTFVGPIVIVLILAFHIFQKAYRILISNLADSPLTRLSLDCQLRLAHSRGRRSRQ